eukprot:TRINITY_DN4671_c0_g1_i2.p1 TRINITY_DN4671_c0_g1~~TRINITY_DN4671_c0_g1_i2.p1  ORF type:complete len:608 (-),score=87.10 TRINITY_DN4671_c0_g1_i2:29-1852(-)
MMTDHRLPKLLVKSIKRLATYHADTLFVHAAAVSAFLLECLQGSDGVVICASNCLATLASTCGELLSAHVNELVPCLLTKMVYSYEVGLAKEQQTETSEMEEVWSARKACADALDCLSHAYGGSVAAASLPIIHDAFEQRNTLSWYIVESAVLGLGAISEGCEEQLQPFVQEHLQQLIDLLHNSHPLVRSITCWTVSRCIKSAAPQAVQLAQSAFACIRDNHREVKHAALSAIAVFAEEIGTQMEPVVGELLPALTESFQYEDERVLRVLCDAIATTFTNVPAVQEAAYTDFLATIIQAAMTKLSGSSVSVQDALLCCLCEIVEAVGIRILPWAPAIFLCCVQVLLQSTDSATAATLELLSAMEPFVHGLHTLARDEKATIMLQSVCEKAMLCLESEDSDLASSAAVLIGEMAVWDTELVQSHVDTILQKLERLLASGPVCCNASWALANLIYLFHAKPCGPLARQLLSLLSHAMKNLLSHAVKNRETPDALGQNLCFAICALTLVDPTQVDYAFYYPTPESLFEVYCSAVAGSMQSNCSERERTVLSAGITALVRTDPHLVTRCSAGKCAAALCKLRDTMGTRDDDRAWPALLAVLPAEAQQWLLQ